jgi:hypothetical protein
LRDGYTEKNGFVFQVDRASNFDGFEEDDLDRLFRTKPQKKKKRMGVTNRMSMPTTPMSAFEIFGDPTNLQKKTQETSLEHLIIEPVCHFRDFFEKGRIHSKPTPEQRKL